ncbi:MAG: hypothetical protein IR159_09705 [Brevundimonas sp.]|nr:hypothetical protein [Brevundimonas sp.]
MSAYRILPGSSLPLLAGLVFAAAVPATASAQSFDFTFGVASENIGKGLGKSDGEPSVSGEVELGHGDFYATLSASTVDIAQGADTEIVAGVGYAPEIGAYKFDFSAVQKTLSGAPAGYDNRFMEYQADMSRAVGPVGLRMRVNYSPDSSGGTEEAWWVELQGGVAVGARSRATIALGERTQNGQQAYVAWNAGVKHKLTDKFALDVRWYDTDSHELGERDDGRLVAALTFAL